MSCWINNTLSLRMKTRRSAAAQWSCSRLDLNLAACVMLRRNTVRLVETCRWRTERTKQTAEWSCFVIRLTLVRSFLAFSSLSISTFWALAGRTRHTHMSSGRTQRCTEVQQLTERFIVGVLWPAMRIKHIFWVVGSQLVYATKLNELLVNAERKPKINLMVNFSDVGRQIK